MRKAFVLGLLACAATLSPALAAARANVYVPLAAPAAGEVVYKTVVLVSNTGEAERRFTANFVPADGAAAPRTHSGVVPPKATYVLIDFAAGGRGLLAISGAPQLAVTARIEARSRDGQLLSSAAVPVAAAADLLPAGGTAHLQGLERTVRTVAGLGIVNPGERGAVCTVAAFRADGSRIAAPFAVAVAPGSQRRVADPLREGRIVDARLEVTCDAPFFAYADLLAADGSRTGFVPPSAQIQAAPELRPTIGMGDGDDHERDPRGGGDDDEGDDGGGTGGGQGGGTGGGGNGNPVPTDPSGLSFQIPGLFFEPRQGDSYKQIVLSLQNDVRYRAVTVEFDLFVNRWQTPLFHNITSLRRTDRTLYYGLIMRADKARTLLDLGREKFVKQDGPWRQQTSYRVRLVFDGANKKVIFQLFDQAGNKVHEVNGKATTTDLRPVNGKVVKIDFGSLGIGDGAYFPTIGWRYSNLKVRIDR